MPRKAKPGRGLGIGPPEGESWTWQTKVMLGTLTHMALSISARRVLDFLKYEHCAHNGEENGNLVAPYRQLAAWGVTEDDIPHAFAELTITGWVEQTKQGFRIAGSPEPSRFALTWLATGKPGPGQKPASNKWRAVQEQLSNAGINTLPKVRRWLKGVTADKRRGTSRKRATPPQMRERRPAYEGPDD